MLWQYKKTQQPTRIPLRIAICLMLMVLYSCRPLKYIEPTQSIITKNKINGASATYKNQALSIVAPRPNRRLLAVGPRTKLWLYLRAINKEIITHRDSILINKIGEPPALYDSIKISESAKAIENFLFDKGHFGSKVTTQYKTRRKRTTVTYMVQQTPPYTIINIKYFEGTQPIDQEINQLKSGLLLKIGGNYDLDLINQERTRITKALREKGYMLFNKDFIALDVDTNFENNRKISLIFKTKPTEEPHIYQTFRFDSIRVNTNYDIFSINKFAGATAYRVDDYWFYTTRISPTNPRVIAGSILFKPGDLYSESALRLTQNRLSELNVFGYVNSQLRPVVQPKTTTNSQKVNVDILLSPAKKRDIKMGFEASTLSGTNPGISALVGVRNKNYFGGAEVLSIQGNGGLESQIAGQNSPLEPILGIFNTYELGLNASLYIPRFIKPLKNSKILQKAEAARTNISLSGLRQARAEYTRLVAKGSLGYEWKSDKTTAWGFYPIELNLGRTPFINQQYLDSILLQDPYQRFSFSDHFTTNTRITYTKNKLNEIEGYFFRTSIESAGNLYNITARSLGQSPKTIFGLPIFRYIRTDFDVRKYLKLSQNGTLALRNFVGIGLPLRTDSLTLPIEKLYVIGGANSLRAWNTRELGIGKNNYYKDRRPQFAELKIEMSAEYRLQISKAANLAFFIDAGNIYSMANGSGNKFKFNDFYKYLAINTGAGIRYNISYVVLRLDVGVKLSDPAFYDTGNSWVIKNIGDRNWRRTDWQQALDLNYNIKYRFFVPQVGIGLPF
jgi:outer membrane protein assembly factor BamA